MATFKHAILLCAMPIALVAQSAQQLTPQQAATLSDDQLRDLSVQLQSALQANDLKKAFSLASTLANALGPKTLPAVKSKADQIRDLEAVLASVSREGRPLMSNSIAVKALSLGDLDKAKYNATEALRALELARLPADSSIIPQVQHESNIVLGTVAYRNGDLFEARKSLIAAGKLSPGSSHFPGPWGPDFTLVKALIDHGDADAALEYFAALRTWWKDGTAQLDQWSAALRGGGKPILPASSRGF